MRGGLKAPVREKEWSAGKKKKVKGEPGDKGSMHVDLKKRGGPTPYSHL